MPLNAWLALAALGTIVLAPLWLVTSPVWGLWLLGQSRRRRREHWRTVLPFMARTIERYAEAMIRGGDPPSGGWTQVARAVDGYLATIRLSRRWRIQMLLVGMELAPVLTLRKPFSALTLAARERFLDERLSTTRGLFGLFGLGRQMIRLGYYGAADRQAEVGFLPVERRHAGRRARSLGPQSLQGSAS